MVNEKRLIDANALMDIIRQHEYSLATKQGAVDYGMFTLGIQQAVDEQPTVDAVEVVHGRWEGYESDETFGPYDSKWWYKCSECGKDAFGRCDQDEWYSSPILSDYCPNCGAKMRGEEE